jgi:hypothetical protein
MDFLILRGARISAATCALCRLSRRAFSQLAIFRLRASPIGVAPRRFFNRWQHQYGH